MDYKEQLGAVLRRRDPAALHLFLRQSAASYGDERQVAEVEERSHEEMAELMHRMILARADLADLHAESQAWLAGRDPGQPLPGPRPPGGGSRAGMPPGRPGGPRRGGSGGRRPRGS